MPFLRCQTRKGQKSAQAFGFLFLRHLHLFAPKPLTAFWFLLCMADSRGRETCNSNKSSKVVKSLAWEFQRGVDCEMLWHSHWWLVHLWVVGELLETRVTQPIASTTQHHPCMTPDDMTTTHHYTSLLSTTYNCSIWHFTRFSELASHSIRHPLVTPLPWRTCGVELPLTSVPRPPNLWLQTLQGQPLWRTAVTAAECSGFCPFVILGSYDFNRLNILYWRVMWWFPCQLVLAFCFGAGAFCEGDPRSLCNWLETIQWWQLEWCYPRQGGGEEVPLLTVVPMMCHWYVIDLS